MCMCVHKIPQIASHLGECHFSLYKVVSVDLVTWVSLNHVEIEYVLRRASKFLVHKKSKIKTELGFW